MTLSVFQATITNESGDILPGAEVSVILESTGLAATIYSTRGGAALSNPFFADASGFAQFYANAGEYRIVATSGVFSRTWRYVRLGDGGAKDVGTAATRDVGTAAGEVMEVGAFGLGGRSVTAFSNTGEWYSIFNTGAKNGINYASNDPLVDYGVGMFLSSGAGSNLTESLILQGALTNRIFYGHLRDSSQNPTLLEGLTKSVAGVSGAANTTVDGSGFIKTASPIVKLYADKIEANDYKEIEDCTFERIGTGHYIIKGAPLLSRDGWYIETLKDRNNNIYFTLDYEELEDGLHIKTYEPDYSTGRATNGAPVDINEGRFVTLRFEEDPSLYPTPKEPEESVK